MIASANFSFLVRDIASHRLLRVDGLTTDVYSLVDDEEWAIAYTYRTDAQAVADALMNDFSHEFAGMTFEVIPVRY